MSPPELADSARRAAREALAAYDGIEVPGAAEGPHAVHGEQSGQRGGSRFEGREQGL